MNHSTRSAWWMLSPWLAGLLLLTVFPALASIVLSLTQEQGTGPGTARKWVGLENYRTAIGFDRPESHVPNASNRDTSTNGRAGMTQHASESGTDLAVADPSPWYVRAIGGRPRDARFLQSLHNTLWFAFVAVPLGLCSALALALLLNRPLRGGAVIRSCIYLPHLLGGVATIVIWSWLLNPQFGWINRAIQGAYVALDPLVRLFLQGGTSNWPLPDWLYSPYWCKPALVLMHTWTVGGAMLIFLAALRRVPSDVLEAAAIDGAGSWRRFRYVTWSHLTPVVFFNLIVGLIFAMQSFSESYLLQNRRQGDALLFCVRYVYEVAFEPPYRLGYASALCWILLFTLVVIVMPLMWGSRLWVHYHDEP